MSGCSSFATNLQLLADGELVGSEKEDILKHIASCPSCQVALEDMQAFSQHLRQSKLQRAPEALCQRVEAMLAEAGASQTEQNTKVWRMPSRSSSSHKSKAMWYAAVAAVLTIAIGLTLSYRRLRPESQANDVLRGQASASASFHTFFRAGPIPSQRSRASPDSILATATAMTTISHIRRSYGPVSRPTQPCLPSDHLLLPFV